MTDLNLSGGNLRDRLAAHIQTIERASKLFPKAYLIAISHPTQFPAMVVIGPNGTKVPPNYTFTDALGECTVPVMLDQRNAVNQELVNELTKKAA